MLGAIWNTLFYQPILNLLLGLYGLFGNNLGWAIIVLTIIIRGLLFPFMKKQYESSAKLRQLQPQLAKIQKKYKRNPQKVQEEQLKLYRNVGYNPLGCLVSTLLPFPVLIAIYQTIRLFSSGEEITGVYVFIENFLGMNGNITIDPSFFGLDLSLSYLPLAQEHGYFVLWVLPYLILALLTGLSQYFSVQFNQKLMGADIAEEKKKKEEEKNKAKKKKDDSQPNMSEVMGDMSKSMKYTFPAMSVFIAISLPAAVSLYWILQSWIPVILYQAYNKFNTRSNGK